MKRPRLISLGFAVAAVMSLCLAGQASAQLTFNYNYTVGTNVTDNGQITNTQTLGGLDDISNVAVRLNLTSPDGDNPMVLGDMYSTLTMGAGVHTAVLLNRPGVDDGDGIGSMLGSLNVTLDDSASHTNIWATTGSTGTYNSDGRGGVDPYDDGVAFSDGDRDKTLGGLNGAAVSGNQFTLLMADTSQGGQAQLNGWGASITGTAATSGTVDAGSAGTLSIDDGGSATTNTLGASVSTTQNGSGGVLNVTLAGTTTFSGGVSGSGGLTKLGNGTLIINSTGDYTGTTTISAGTLQLGDGGTAGTLATTSAIVDNGNFTINRSDDVVQGTDFSGSAITGSGSLTQQGTGTLTLNAANTYSGGTNINAGTLALGSSGAIGTTGTISFGGGTLQYSASNTTDYSSRFSTAASQQYKTDTNSQDVSWASNLTSSGGTLTKLGSGTLTLTGNNTFSGATTINNGTVEAAAAGALGATSAVTVNSTGTLRLSGSGNLNRVNDAAGITLNGGTILRIGEGEVSEGTGASNPGSNNVPPALGPNVPTPKPISGTSTVGLGALTLTANSTFDFGTDGGVGTFTFASFNPNGGAGGPFTLTILNWTSGADAVLNISGADGTDDRLIFNQDQSGNLGSFNFGGGFTAQQIALDDGFWEIVGVTAVPEPSTWVAGALALISVLFMQRRRVG